MSHSLATLNAKSTCDDRSSLLRCVSMSRHPLPVARNATLAALGIMLLSLPSCGGPSGPIDGNRAYGHVEKFVAIGPRPFGSDALAETADYICAEIEAIGLKAERHEVEHKKEKLMIRNLYTRIDGPDPEKGPILMIGAHYDTKLAAEHEESDHNFPFVGAIDGGGAPAVLIELARELKKRQAELKVNVWLYWIDAEESIDWVWNDDRALLGSQAFCAWLDQADILRRVKAFVLLDLIGDKNLKIDRDGNSSKDLLDIFGEAGKEMGIAERMYEFPTKQQIQEYRNRGLNWGTKDDHIVFRRFSVPSVLLIDFARRTPAEPADERYASGGTRRMTTSTKSHPIRWPSLAIW